MAEARLDHPGDVHWFSGYGPAQILGPCPHTECAHNALSDIAWGPDFEHYTLVTCDVANGCNGYCRAWAAEHPQGEGPKHRLGQLLQTDTSEQVLRTTRKEARRA